MTPTPSSLLEDAITHARSVLINTKSSLLPTFVAATPSGLAVIATPWSDSREKRAAGEAVRAYLHQHHATAYSFVSEVWTAQQSHDPSVAQLTPSQRSDRKECVLAFATDGLTPVTRLLEIKRFPDGACVALTEEPSLPDAFEGWLLDLLQ